MGHVEHPVDRIAAEFDIFRHRDAVTAESRQRHVHLDELLSDERTLGVARPLDQCLRRAGLDAAELRGEVEIATRIAFFMRRFQNRISVRRALNDSKPPRPKSSFT